MKTLIKSLLCTVALGLIAAAPLTRAQDSAPWSVGLSAVAPTGGAREWVGSTTGFSLDLMQSFFLGYGDTVRMRLGYFGLKGPRSTPQMVAFPGRLP